METLHDALPQVNFSVSGLELPDFCARYSQEEAQQQLWKWFVLALKDSQTSVPSASTSELIVFYEQLRKLLSAVYQLHDHLTLVPVPGPVHREEETCHGQHIPPQPASLAAALDTLHHTVSHGWILLICPPE
ncbi:MAG: hypothetical protein LPK07_15670 [Hymenobacteraceae bacterium]|nr:hypothetical protein [Hymenobacteraceae bacterium]